MLHLFECKNTSYISRRTMHFDNEKSSCFDNLHVPKTNTIKDNHFERAKGPNVYLLFICSFQTSAQ